MIWGHISQIKKIFLNKFWGICSAFYVQWTASVLQSKQFTRVPQASKPWSETWKVRNETSNWNFETPSWTLSQSFVYFQIWCSKLVYKQTAEFIKKSFKENSKDFMKSTMSFQGSVQRFLLNFEFLIRVSKFFLGGRVEWGGGMTCINRFGSNHVRFIILPQKSSEPSIKPKDFKATTVEADKVTVKWTKLTQDESNGPLQGYKIEIQGTGTKGSGKEYSVPVSSFLPLVSLVNNFLRWSLMQTPKLYDTMREFTHTNSHIFKQSEIIIFLDFSGLPTRKRKPLECMTPEKMGVHYYTTAWLNKHTVNI